MKRLKLILATLALTVLVGCDNVDDDIIQITFWHVLNGSQETLLQTLTDEFTAQNEGITINLVNKTNHSELSSQITAALISPKTLPTISQAYIDWMLNPIADGLVIDILPYILSYPDGQNRLDDCIDGFIKPLMINDALYGLPFTKSSEVIWYNKTLFDELGLKPPTSFEELTEVSKIIYSEKGIPGAGFDSLSNYFYTYLYGNGVKYDPTNDNQEILNEMVNYYLDGVNEGYFRISGTDRFLSQPFGDEMLGMYIGSTASESFITDNVDGKFEIEAAPHPAGYSIQQGTDVFIFSSADDSQKEAAYAYLRHLASPEVQQQWAIETGYLPIKESVLEIPEYKESDSHIPKLDFTLYSKTMVTNANTIVSEIELTLETILSSQNPDVEKEMLDLESKLLSYWD
ncbi:MAG: hypothetical protein ATN34_02865 [Epulopiscium sp. Nele67-Bin002]|nr:MAG: hypothetical protein ATN34_02865 [Epulopiscium sp. Nele67-Bin002]OON92596.1 MAG: hypothetical protein ATN33_06995 [Epulopiscium sp. Nele67-Bin001]